MEKMQPMQFGKELKRTDSVPFVTRLCSLGLFLALLLFSSQPTWAASSPSPAHQQSTGYWRFLETNQSSLGDPAPAPDTGTISVGANSMSGSYSHNPPGDAAWVSAFECSWTWDSPSGMDRLIPGQNLSVSMTLTDLGDWANSNSGGSIRFDKPYLGASVTWENSIYLLNSRVYRHDKGTVSPQAEVAIPGGPVSGWENKMGIKVTCGSAYGNSGTFERVYEWVPQAPAGEITPESTGTGGATPTPVPGGGGLGWIVVVGGLAAVGAAALAAVVAAGVGAAVILRRRGKKAPSKQSSPPKYILQLSAQSLEVKVGQSAPLFIQAWRITPTGSTVPAPEAVIQVSLPPSLAGLVVTPAMGQGTLECAFSAVNPTQCAQVTATVTASAGGLGAAAQVAVRLVPVYGLQVGSQDPQNRVQPGGPGLAAWAEVRATPPDPQSPPDTLTRQVTFSVVGANSDWVRCQPLAFKDVLQWVQLNAAAPAPGASMQPGNPVLVASCMAGTQRLEGRLNLLMNEELVLDAWADGKKLAEVRYNDVSDPPGWFFGGISVYFHPPDDENKVVVPPFKCNLSNPDLQMDPAGILELRNYHSDERPGWYTGEIRLRDGLDLEDTFGPDLLEKNAQITLTIGVTDESGKPYQSKITYQICPTVELGVRQCDEKYAPISSRKGVLSLGAMEFVADGEDALNMMMFYRRTDWERDADRSVPFGSLLQVELHGLMSDEFKLGVDSQVFTPLPGRDAAWRTRVVSARPLMDTPKRRGQKLGLRVTGGLQNAPQHYRYKTMDVDTGQDIVDQELKPLYLYLGLWVVPGQERGTSLAGAVGFARGGNGKLQPLPKKTPLEISPVVQERSVVGSSDGFLALAGGFEELSLTSEPLSSLVSTGRLHNNPIELPNWLSVWKLRYNGLRWSNVDKGRFDVYCRFQGAEEGVVFRIDVRENLAYMVADLDANNEAVDLTNKEWQTYSLTGTLGMFLARRECRGFLYNTRWDIMKAYCSVKGIPVPDAYEHYVCGQYSLRLARYLVHRRNGTVNPETALKMNGVEGCQFKYTPIHDWFGFHLSGTKPDQEPIFIDPWWTQEWNIQEVKDNYGFKMQTARLTAVLTLLATYVVLLGRFMVWFFQAGRAGVGEIFPLELSAAEIRAILWDLARRWGWHLANILQNLTSWYLQTPQADDPTLFDDDLNYARYSGLELFVSYKDNLLQATPVPDQSVEAWPKP